VELGEGRPGPLARGDRRALDRPGPAAGGDHVPDDARLDAGGRRRGLPARRPREGGGPPRLRLRHQARVALAPTLTLAGAATNATLINLAIVERVFGASGSFRRLDDAVATADVGLLLGLTFLIAST
jgi:hypothetical protein